MKDVKELALEIAGIFEREGMYVLTPGARNSEIQLIFDAVLALRTIPGFTFGDEKRKEFWNEKQAKK